MRPIVDAEGSYSVVQPDQVVCGGLAWTRTFSRKQTSAMWLSSRPERCLLSNIRLTVALLNLAVLDQGGALRAPLARRQGRALPWEARPAHAGPPRVGACRSTRLTPHAELI